MSYSNVISSKTASSDWQPTFDNISKNIEEIISINNNLERKIRNGKLEKSKIEAQRESILRNSKETQLLINDLEKFRNMPDQKTKINKLKNVLEGSLNKFFRLSQEANSLAGANRNSNNDARDYYQSNYQIGSLRENEIMITEGTENVLKQESNQVKHEEELLFERQKELNDIDKLIYNIKGLVYDGAQKIQEQGKNLDNITNNVEKTNINVIATTNELKEANNLAKKATRKWAILIIVMILIIAVVLAVVLSQVLK